MVRWRPGGWLGGCNHKVGRKGGGLEDEEGVYWLAGWLGGKVVGWWLGGWVVAGWLGGRVVGWWLGGWIVVGWLDCGEVVGC